MLIKMPLSVHNPKSKAKEQTEYEDKKIYQNIMTNKEGEVDLTMHFQKQCNKVHESRFCKIYFMHKI